MKFLLFSDLHASLEHAHKLVELSAEADVLIGAGDFGNMRKQTADCIKVLRTVDKPAVLVPGNAESVEELRKAAEIWPSAEVLHGTGTMVKGVSFWGLGGGVPTTPFGSWSYDFTEDEARNLLFGCPSNGILISHSPPKGLVDLASDGKNWGSEAVLETIRSKRPKMVVCGHIHHSWRKSANAGGTVVWNAGIACPCRTVLERDAGSRSGI